ncbi:TetR/AcrR family transcriptional regulator [Rhodopseudomonas palustris]|nr:TetR/AcrR family transcriptional regulator [Rhodopseudomonas palustris]
MAGSTTGGKRVAAAPGSGVARLVPSQARSRERFERILTCAAEVMAEKGSEDFRMSDIVARTGIAFGSLYQYFPDKTAIIATLAERLNAEGHDCIRRELAALKRTEDLHDVLGAITDGYYQFFHDEPVVRCVWLATQADRALQQLDADDGAFLAGLLAEALRRVAPRAPEAALRDFAQLMIVLIAATVRHAITLPPREAKRVLALFKRTLPKDFAAL